MARQRANERIELLNSGDEQRVLFDLSKGGACCLYSKKLDKGQYVRITLDDLQLRARITYCIDRTDGYRLGMQFWSLDQAQQKGVDALVERFSRGVPVGCRLEEDPGGG
jgi:hypothetical protein